MILVLGGGFGLYGHVAALAMMGCEVATLARYRPVIEGRPELAPLLDRVILVEEAQGVRDATIVTLAQRPHDNRAAAERLAEAGFAGGLVIEKPAGPDPEAAHRLQHTLFAAGLRWAVPYLFLYADWAQQIRDAVVQSAGADVTLSWSFPQSRTSRAWKREPKAGGGSLGFYFIHCIALAEWLAEGAANSALSGTSSATVIELAGSVNNSHISFRFDKQCPEAHFLVRINGRAIARAATPFGALPQAGMLDPRIPLLQRFYESTVMNGAYQNSAFHQAVLERWRELDRYGS